MSYNNIKDVVWLQTGFLGDIILNTAAIELIYNEFGTEIRQHFITTPIGYEALNKDPRLSSIIVFDKKKHNFFYAAKIVKLELKKNLLSFADTLLLQPHRSLRSSLLAKYLGLKTVTYYESALHFISHIQFSRISVFHEAHRIALLTQALGISRDKILKSKPKLYSYEDNLLNQKFDDIVKLKSNYFLVGIAPGSVWGTKKWPSNYYARLIEMLLENYDNIVVILLGSNAEKQDTNYIIDNVSNKYYSRVVNLAGRTTLLDLRWLYPRLDMVISNDSSPTHYASAFNIPSIVIFGSTIPQMGFSPMSDNSVVAEISLSCRPCSEHGPQRCPLKHFKCMKDLSVDFVFQQTINMLENIISQRCK